MIFEEILTQLKNLTITEIREIDTNKLDEVRNMIDDILKVNMSLSGKIRLNNVRRIQNDKFQDN